MFVYDLVVKGGNVVIPYVGVRKADIGINGEKITAISENIADKSADRGDFSAARDLAAV